MNRDHSDILEIAPNYCISDSIIDSEVKGFLPTLDRMVIWIKFAHSYISHPKWDRAEFHFCVRELSEIFEAGLVAGLETKGKTYITNVLISLRFWLSQSIHMAIWLGL